MEESEARLIVRKLFAVCPAVKTYHSERVDPDCKLFVMRAWIAALAPYSVESADQALTEWPGRVEVTNNVIANPMQALLGLMRQDRPGATRVGSGEITRCDRSERQSNCLESFEAALAAAGDSNQLRAILDGVL